MYCQNDVVDVCDFAHFDYGQPTQKGLYLNLPYKYVCIMLCVLFCIALHCVVLCCVVLCCVLYCIALHCVVLCIVLYCIALHCIALHCIALHCIVLYCIVLYCVFFSFGVDLQVMLILQTLTLTRN